MSDENQSGTAEVVPPAVPASADHSALGAPNSSLVTPNSSLPSAGGSRELLKLAFPLIVSQSFMTVQVVVDTVLLAWHNQNEMAASFPAAMWYWLFFVLLQITAGYTSTFVAQYTGAKRAHRVGPAVWQGIYFAVVAGLLFLVLVPLAPTLISWGDHTEEIQRLETIYLQCLCFAALPMLIMSAINGFFSGRGHTWTVLGIEALGTLVNIALALVLIFGEGGIAKYDLPGVPGAPALGIAGAGWATVAGSWAAALFALVLFLRAKYRTEFNTGAWKPEPPLFRRLMRFGGLAGTQVFLDVLVFHLFVIYVGRLGEAELGATTLTVRLNMIAFLPMMGLGQAICILVGQRLGENRPDLAERSTYTGLKCTFGYMLLVAIAYVTIPKLLIEPFRPDAAAELEKFEAIAAIVPNLLLCVALFSLTDAINVSFSFALRGAGDTKFVTLLTFALAWPLMVIPTYAAWRLGASVYWCWAFATLHIMVMSACFWFRFRSGKWKSMRVIEPAVTDEK